MVDMVMLLNTLGCKTVSVQLKDMDFGKEQHG